MRGLIPTLVHLVVLVACAALMSWYSCGVYRECRAEGKGPFTCAQRTATGAHR